MITHPGMFRRNCHLSFYKENQLTRENPSQNQKPEGIEKDEHLRGEFAVPNQ